MDHHPQVFEDVINNCDVRLMGQKYRCRVWEIVASRTSARNLAFIGTSNCLMANSRSWISFRSSSVTASVWACIWESLQEENQLTEHDTDNNVKDKKYKKWSYLTNWGASRKFSSGCPPCERKEGRKWRHWSGFCAFVCVCVCAGFSPTPWSWLWLWPQTPSACWLLVAGSSGSC